MFKEDHTSWNWDLEAHFQWLSVKRMQAGAHRIPATDATRGPWRQVHPPLSAVSIQPKVQWSQHDSKAGGVLVILNNKLSTQPSPCSWNIPMPRSYPRPIKSNFQGQVPGVSISKNTNSFQVWFNVIQPRWRPLSWCLPLFSPGTSAFHVPRVKPGTHRKLSAWGTSSSFPAVLTLLPVSPGGPSDSLCNWLGPGSYCQSWCVTFNLKVTPTVKSLGVSLVTVTHRGRNRDFLF